MSKFTPGPWRIENEFIATNTQNIAEIIPDTGSDEEIAANARLISAAPDLLAALEAMAREFPDSSDNVGLKAIADARAALARVKGD